MFGFSVQGIAFTAKAVAIAGAAGFIAGAAAGGAGTVTLYEKVIVPGRETRAEDRARLACATEVALKTKAAAAEAIAGELTRRNIAINAAIAAHQVAAARNAQDQAQKLEELERENKAYVAKLAETGKSCPLDDDDLRFLVPGAGELHDDK